MRIFNFVGGLVIGLAGGVFLGGVVGIYFGEQNAYIDFCMDDGTTKYITDDNARKVSC